MSNNVLEKVTLAQIQQFFEQHQIRSISLEQDNRVDDNAEVCNVRLFLINTDDADKDMPIFFKLEDGEVDIFRYIKKMKLAGDLQLELGELANEIETEQLNKKIRTFFADINKRTARIKQEEDVQKITFVGNTFVLNKKTPFKVLKDEESKLTLEMYTKTGTKEAFMSATDLVDGLYMGLISQEK